MRFELVKIDEIYFQNPVLWQVATNYYGIKIGSR